MKHLLSCLIYFLEIKSCRKSHDYREVIVFQKFRLGTLLGFVRARANDAKIVRSRDAQCNTKELP